MPDNRGRYINEIVDQPGFERIRGEIITNLNDRAREAQQAFNGLTTFCGLAYTGATAAILSFIGSRSSAGVPYIAILSFVLLSISLIIFSILYQMHSQLIARRHELYAVTARNFFERRATIEEMLQAGHLLQAKYLYRLIFWLPLTFAVGGLLCGALSVLGVGSTVPPLGNGCSNGTTPV